MSAAETAESRDGDILRAIHARLPALSTAHRKIAEMILADPRAAVQSNVDDLAARAGVAKPTIVRFARAVGCAGLKDLKLRLAASVALGARYLHRAVRASDSTDDVVDNVVGGVMSALAEWRRLLDADVLMAAAKALHRAARVDCYGVGATSHFLALDLQARLFRIGQTATAYTDAYLQLVAAATLAPADAVVAISFVGRMPHLLETIETARARGAVVIAITRRNTPLARAADIVLPVDAPADATMPVGADAYVTQTMMIEIIAILVGRLRGAQGARRLERIHRLMKAKVQDNDESSVVYWGWKNAPAR